MGQLARKQKVKLSKLYEPKIDEPGTKRDVSRQKRDILKMKKKLKDESRAARKAMTADAAYIAKMKLKEQKAKDEERRGKTKRILGQLANQEGETKNIKKKKYNLFPDI